MTSARFAQQKPVGLLALQGSFDLHAKALSCLGVPSREVRKTSDLEGLAAIILPGGESTVMSLLARKSGLFDALQSLGREGLPMFGTCAGAILLGRGKEPPPRLGVADVELLRNAYGRQVDSFSAPLELRSFPEPFHGIFIRAPKMMPADGVEVLGEHDGDPVLVRSGRTLLATFHPELTNDLRIHRYFLEQVAALDAVAS